ncbi:MAG: addiction module protein [Thermodesulfobacteriota bacterium]
MNKELVEQVLKMEPADRMKLLEIIHGSLEKPDAAIDELWYDEAERRLHAFKAGKVEGIPAGQVLGYKQ